jgi:RNA polymerase sigma-70 factor (ECF subfamily)
VKPGDAEDLAQDVLMVVWRRWGDYDRRRPLRPWLSGIASRVARDFLKRRWREVLHGQIDVIDPALIGEDQVESARARGLVAEALAALPDRHRMAIVLYDLQGQAPHQIARAMGVPISTAYTRLRRAHQAFARELARIRKSGGERPLASFAPAPRRAFVAGIGAAMVATLALLLSARPARPALGRSAAAKSHGLAGAPASLRTGLVGYWTFDEPAGSAVARDHSGRGRDCVLHDLDPGRAWTAGQIGGAVDLRAGGWLECPQPPLLGGRPAPDMTVMARVKAGLTEEAHSAVATREMGSDHDDLFFFGFIGDRLKVSSRAWLGWISRPVPAARDRWVHIAFTRQAGGRTRLFLDGVQVGENQQGERLVPGPEATPLTIGAGHVGFEGGALRQHFAGLVDELAVYDRALPPEEVAAAAATRVPLTL